MHEIELNGLYKKFDDKVNDKIKDYSNGQLANKLPDIEFTVLKSTSMSLIILRLLILPRLYHSSRPRFPTIFKFILKQLRSY